jgi:hypothetical protein
MRTPVSALGVLGVVYVLPACDSPAAPEPGLEPVCVVGLVYDPWNDRTVFYVPEASADALCGPAFSDDVEVPVGARVEFWNREASARIVSTAEPPDGSSFDSGLLAEDERFRFTPGVAGKWDFIDEVSRATGTLTAR